jgi:hypothetical protein
LIARADCAQGILDETLMIALRAMGDCLALNGGVRPFLDQLDKNKDGTRPDGRPWPDGRLSPHGMSRRGPTAYVARWQPRHRGVVATRRDTSRAFGFQGSSRRRSSRTSSSGW